ncbi:hypothetical protein O59_001845 [Cellvibrio sp. BR]|nr:hypothetical protein O59_001845 [Cellvibrio sp. BR]
MIIIIKKPLSAFVNKLAALFIKIVFLIKSAPTAWQKRPL